MIWTRFSPRRTPSLHSMRRRSTARKNVRLPGTDQAVLYRYFRSIGYDYTHPEIGPEWNSCAGVTKLTRRDGLWTGRTLGLRADHDVFLVHYWSQFKPWLIGCPVYADYVNRA